MFKDLSLKKSYSSSSDNVLQDFYIPVLSEAVYYGRTTGFFSSYSLVKAAKGMAYFYSHEGECELLSGLQLSSEDYEALRSGVKNVSSFFDENFINNASSIQDKILFNHLKFLSWLVSENKLKIKVAAVADKSDAIYHEKFGVFRDINGDEISFLGSINETAAGWEGNIEQFLVFRSWIDEERDYVEINKEKFKEYWENQNERVTVFELPDAIKQKIIDIKPNDDEVKKIIDDLKKYKETNYFNPTKKDDRKLREYQSEAIKSWENNNNKGILSMATGSGKTFTAIKALEKVSADKKFLSVIVVPYGHLVSQWLNDIQTLLRDYQILRIDSKNSKWRQDLKKILFNFEEGYIKKVILIGTYVSMCSESFIDIFNQYITGNCTAIVADEVHNFGAKQSLKGMLEQYNYRMGLSATPERYFDEEGTQNIYEYFDKVVYEYDIEQAIKDKNLTPYDYYVFPTKLDEDEMAKYYEITERMKKVFNREDKQQNEIYVRLAIQRSRILKRANGKFGQVDLILDMLAKKYSRLDHLLIYCDNLEQLNQIQSLINTKYFLTTHKFTGDESLDIRKSILEKFDIGDYQVLLAIKCLDEGVDVPSTDKAIIVASSGNSREYIQRRGRVLRLYKNKAKAEIYDLLVLPPDKNEEAAKILQKEFKRVSNFCETASNASEVSRDLFGIMNEYGVYF